MSTDFSLAPTWTSRLNANPIPWLLEESNRLYDISRSHIS